MFGTVVLVWALWFRGSHGLVPSATTATTARSLPRRCPTRLGVVEGEKSVDESPQVREEPQLTVACVGEVLFDSLPTGVFLGGAPCNVGAHVAALGHRAELISVVGGDDLGLNARKRLTELGVGIDGVDTRPWLPTGFVRCSVDPETGDASYNFTTPAAWDTIVPTLTAYDIVGAADAVVHGSLALRDERCGIEDITDVCRRRIFDVNLRYPYVDEERIRPLLKDCWLLKMNLEELNTIASWYVKDPSRADVEDLARYLTVRLNARYLCVTRGSRGAFMVVNEIGHVGDIYNVDGLPKILEGHVVDTVGAGDAFTASLALDLMRDEDDNIWQPDHALMRAVALGMWVATKPGATPDHDLSKEQFFDLVLPGPARIQRPRNPFRELDLDAEIQVAEPITTYGDDATEFQQLQRAAQDALEEDQGAGKTPHQEKTPPQVATSSSSSVLRQGEDDDEEILPSAADLFGDTNGVAIPVDDEDKREDEGLAEATTASNTEEDITENQQKVPASDRTTTARN